LSHSTPKYRTFGCAAQCAKRVFDVIVAIIALILTAPLFLIVVVLIKLDSSGPVFFRQVRVGRQRRRFRMWKFRKMHDDLPTQGPSLTRRYDARLTRFGRILERTKLDELPQLFNVLVGDMSIVGPRPEVPQFVEHYPRRWDEVLSVKPGLVGPSQLRFRNESEMYPDDCDDVEAYYAEHILPPKMTLDASYATRFRLAADVVHLVRTVLVAVCGVVTRRTVVNRRAQLLNTAALSLLGLAGTLAAAQVAGKPLAAESVWRTVLLALLTKPLCLLLFKIPNSLATSVTADDLRRCCWCAATSGLLLYAGVSLSGHPAFAILALVADSTTFLAMLVLYKLACYNFTIRCRPGSPGGFARRLFLGSLVLGPVSIAAALAFHHPPAEWLARPGTALALLIALAAVVRPGVVLFTPVALRSGLGRLAGEWCKLAVGTLVGSAVLAAAALAVFQAEVDPTDLALDAVVYLGLATSLLAWGSRRGDRASGRAQDDEAGEERLLIVGGGVELGAYIGALSAYADHRFTIAGALVPRRDYRSHTVGGVPILGGLADAGQVIEALRVTRVVIVGPAVSDAALDRLRTACSLAEHQVVRIEFPGPFLRLPLPDLAEGASPMVGGR
jgi:lipopolysaccharide/colanic/teichoic acid biosynthesis glycosyltransferase